MSTKSRYGIAYLKQISLAVVAVFAASTAVADEAAAQAAPAQPGFYVGGGLGFTLTQSTDFIGPSGTTEIDHDVGFHVRAAGGYRFTNRLRGEVEVSFFTGEIDQVNVNGANVDAGERTSAVAGMLNVMYDLSDGPLVPYLGGGIGLVNLDNDGFDDGSGTVVGEIEDVEVAYQFIAGVGYRMTDKLQLTFDYRYFASTEPSVSAGASGPQDIEFNTHRLTLGANYDF